MTDLPVLYKWDEKRQLYVAENGDTIDYKPAIPFDDYTFYEDDGEPVDEKNWVSISGEDGNDYEKDRI